MLFAFGLVYWHDAVPRDSGFSILSQAARRSCIVCSFDGFQHESVLNEAGCLQTRGIVSARSQKTKGNGTDGMDFSLRPFPLPLFPVYHYPQRGLEHTSLTKVMRSTLITVPTSMESSTQ